MENTTLNFFKAKFVRALMALAMLLALDGFAQTTVTYNMGNTGYFTTVTQGTSGTFAANGNTELGMYSNGGGTKNVVAYRNFMTAGNNTGSVRALQVGDIFSLQVYASAAFGQIGFSLNTTNVTTNYGTRNTNSRLYVQEDGTTGSWYVNSAAGNQTLDYNVSTTYRNYLFKVYITSETTCDVELIVDGSTTKRLFNRTMNGAAGANITGFSLYLSDDWNGSANSNIYWKQVTEVRANTSVNLGYYLTSGSFTPGRVTNGLEANSTSTTSVNALNIGGDAGTTVVLNQPNTYSGGTIVNPLARAELQHAQALGTSPFIDVFNNGAMSLYSPTGITYNNYTAVLFGNGQNGANGAMRNVGGNNVWQGQIQLAGSARIHADIAGSLALNGLITIPVSTVLTVGGTQPITINGGVTGTTLAKDGANTLTLASAFNGFNTLNLYDGIVSIGNAGAVGSATIAFPASASIGTLAFTNSFSVPGQVSVQSTKANIDVANGQMATVTGMVFGVGRLSKSGAGTLSVSSSSTPMSGGFNIGNGYVIVNNGNRLGAGTINLGLDANDVSQGNNVFLQTSGTTTFPQALTVASNASGAARTVQSFLGNTMTFSGLTTLNGTLTVSGNANFSNVISGAGGLTISDGMTTLSAANTYAGNTTVNPLSVLFLGAANTIPNASNIILNGGTFNSGGVSDQVNVLLVEANSTISLQNGSHALTFADSSEETWSGTLTISSWNGVAGQSNTGGGRIMVGVGGLNPAQLAQVVFQGYPGTPIILPSGELVPPGPSLAVTNGAPDHGSACVGVPATTITYTITNTGGDASDVSVVSNNAEFVVSNLSSTTIALGGTATYDVTFTPSASGSRTADITITSSPAGNTPIVSTVTGTGLANVTYYADSDNDNYGDPTDLQVSCTGAPIGYVTNDDDCDDNNDAINPDADEICDGIDNDCDGFIDDADSLVVGAPLWYADADDDNYGNPLSALNACNAPLGYVANDDDCDDNNGAVNPDATEICDGLDNDCDGLTDGDDPSVIGLATWYADTDGDGYGDPAVSVEACSAPANHVADNTDCDDANPAVHAIYPYFDDADNDGYGSMTVVNICAANPLVAPGGFSLNDDDCNDNNNAVHPNAAEIGYNLVDDDCDGSIDEGFPPKVTVVQGAQCNTTLAAIDTQIMANLVAGAQGYHWRITTMSGPNTGQVQTLNTGIRVMKLTQLLTYAYATQYKVEVGVFYAGYPQPFGVSNCTVTTPQGMSTLTNCNQTLTAMSNAVYANIVPFAGGYRFRITDPLNPLNTQVLERPIRDFKMTQVTNFAVQYGKTYNVEVAVRNTDGTWMPYSSACQVTTPVFPTTSLQDSQCDGYLVPTNSTLLYALSYPGAIAYVFQLSGGGLPAPIEVTKGTRAFSINDFAGQTTPGATYNVKVRLIFNHADPAGPYGKTCTITTPGLARPNQVKAAFDAVAYPNPFADHFNIDIRTAATGDVAIKVYDMTGRLLENAIVKAGNTIRPIGNHFPAGVYNVIVSQGDETRTLRVIKR